MSMRNKTYTFFPVYRLPATSWVHYTTSCNTQSGAPEDGRDHRPKHVELIGIINKPLLLHLVGVYIIYFASYANRQDIQNVRRRYNERKTVWACAIKLTHFFLSVIIKIATELLLLLWRVWGSHLTLKIKVNWNMTPCQLASSWRSRQKAFLKRLQAVIFPGTWVFVNVVLLDGGNIAKV